VSVPVEELQHRFIKGLAPHAYKVWCRGCGMTTRNASFNTTMMECVAWFEVHASGARHRRQVDPASLPERIARDYQRARQDELVATWKAQWARISTNSS